MNLLTGASLLAQAKSIYYYKSSIKLLLSNNPPLSNKFPFSEEES